MRAPAQPRRILHAWIVALALAAGCAPTTPVADTSTPKLDVVWVASAPEVIRAMLETAKVGPGDVVLRPGVRERRDRDRRRKALRRPRGGRRSRPRAHPVVTLYLLPELNARLRPKLVRELRPGARIVSHDFGIGDWLPERTVEVSLTRTHRVLLWRIPGG